MAIQENFGRVDELSPRYGTHCSETDTDDAQGYFARNWPWISLLLSALFVCVFGSYAHSLGPGPLLNIHPGSYGFVVALSLGLCALGARATATASARIACRLAFSGAGIAIVWMYFFAG